MAMIKISDQTENSVGSMGVSVGYGTPLGLDTCGDMVRERVAQVSPVASQPTAIVIGPLSRSGHPS